MRIRYKTTYWDIYKFNVVHSLCSPWYQGAQGLVALWIFSTFMDSPNADIGVAAFLAFVWWVALWLLHFVVFALGLAAKNNHSMFVEHTAEVTDEGLFEETKFNKSIYYWPGMVKFVKRPGFVALYISGQQAHVIPKRFFASNAQMNEFRQLVEDHMRRGKAIA